MRIQLRSAPMLRNLLWLSELEKAFSLGAAKWLPEDINRFAPARLLMILRSE